MKILFITYPMAFHTPGGGEVQLLNYAENLRKYGIQVDFFDPWNPNFLSYDLVHFFSCIGGSIPICSFVKNLKIPLVVTSSLWLTEQTKSEYNTNEIREQLLLADRIITNSKMESLALSEVLDIQFEKFSHVHNGVDEVFLNSTLINANNNNNNNNLIIANKDYFLNVANVEPRKNQKLLIEALSQLPEYKLVIAGHVRNEDYFKTSHIEKNSQVYYIEYVTSNSAELRKLYQNCKAFILPSLLETPGIAALEAAACGAKLIITSEGSTKEYFHDNAIYVDPFSVNSIVEAMKLIDVVKPGSNNKNKMIIKTWFEVTWELILVYKSVIEEHNSANKKIDYV